MKPTILTVAGSDSSGGAGIQADLKTITALGFHGATVVTAVTAQNTLGVQDWLPVPAPLVRAQLRSVLEDLCPAAVKTGMLATAEIVRVVAEELRGFEVPHVVCDPVLSATTGEELLRGDLIAAFRELLPSVSLFTPNAREAAALTGAEVSNVEEAARAGRVLLGWGPKAVLVTGGHLPGSPGTDVLVEDEDQVFQVAGRWIDTPHTHGTGCVHSATLAALLGRGADLRDAVREARVRLAEAVRRGEAVGQGPGPVDPNL